ncbi:hypothetical protein FAZ95_36505 [Trinickia violacea]|uniref:Uncharacterized protein n=1 Tax=Trinickia violacea TaxID=2571746 RepID=A0A4P8J217_9BURK|nr:hypothetical protein [Trinickia violacea]QCP54425.1 hypothetical protein FAZ95_36505 [Trinickia violacea]
MNACSTDRFVAGVLLGGCLTAAFVVALMYFGLPNADHSSVFERLITPVLAASCVLYPRPILLKTVLRDRRDAFTLEEDIDAMLLGRTIGVLGGLAMGLTLVTEIL